MNWKEHLILGTKDAIFLFCFIWLPIVIGLIIMYFLFGAEEPRQWGTVFGIVVITSSFAFLAMWISSVYEPNNFWNMLKKPGVIV